MFKPDQAAAVSSPRRSQSSHNAIVKAATEVVAEHGYNNATIERIAVRAGAGKQTIYRWWKTKPYLFLEVYRELVPVANFEADNGSCTVDLEAILARLFKCYRDTPAAAILAGLFAEAQSDAEFAAAFRDELTSKPVKLLRVPLKRGRSRGEIGAKFDIKIAADLIIAAVWHRLLTGDRKLSGKFARRLVATVMAGQEAKKA